MKKYSPLFMCLALVVLGLGLVIASPYATVYSMASAAKRGDGAALSEHIDFPALRQSLKDQMNVAMSKTMAQEMSDNPFAALGAMLGGVMIERAVETYVTPAAITAMMSGRQVSEEGSAGGSTDPFKGASLSYKSFDRFVVSIEGAESAGRFDFVLRRKGLGWHLTEIAIPFESFK